MDYLNLPKLTGQRETTLEPMLADLVRALRRKRGFGLFFVQCQKVQGEEIIAAVQQRLPEKPTQIFELNRQSETLYSEMISAYQREAFEIAFIVGLDQAVLGYEDTKRIAGWTSDEIYTTSWKGVPHLLGHLNRQREAFAEHLPVAMVFLVPSFVIDYFVQRAADFFDWRSGFFKVPESEESLQQSAKAMMGKDFEEYENLSSEDRLARILEIKTLIQDGNLSTEDKAGLLREQGRLFHADQDWVKALDCYDRVIALDPKNYNVLMLKGDLLARMSRYEEAVAIYDSATSTAPEDAELWLSKAKRLHQLRYYEQSIECFDRVLALNPLESIAYDFKALALMDLQRFEDALECFDKALALDDSVSETWHDRGVALSYLGLHQQALDSFYCALRIFPNNPKILHDIKITLSDLGSSDEVSYDSLLEKYDNFLISHPTDHQAWCNRGNILRNLKRYEEALESYDRALQIQPDYVYAWNGRGNTLSDLKRYEEALESYDRALQIQPDFHTAWNGRGIALYYLKRYEEALESYDRALQIQPDDVYAWNNQGYLLLAEQSYGLEPVFEKPLLIRQPTILGNFEQKVILEKEKYQKALDCFEKAIELDPEFILALANCGFAAYYLQQYELALESCKKSLELNPDNREEMNEVIYSNQGCIFLKLNDLEGALKAFNTALNLDTNLSEAWIGKGTTLYYLGYYAEAMYSFTQALNLNHPLAQANLNFTQQRLS